MHIELPNSVQYIIQRLMAFGYSAYAVGGCVRDSLLGRKPDDWDITTSAKPETIKGLFSKTIDTGLQHGTVTVMINHEPFEVTTYRIDGEYEDNRRPKSVEFTDNLIEDLKRRDFTINAMAYNDQHGLIDAFEGLRDIESGIIRCVGNPKERFDEDALRMLRAIRFSAQLDYTIDERTREAIKDKASLIRYISGERIQVELTKLLVSGHPYYFKELYELELLKEIIPEFEPCFRTVQNNPHHKYTVGEHILNSLGYINKSAVLRWSMLFHDIGKPEKKSTDRQGIDHFYGHAELSSKMAKDILKRLKFDNKTIDQVTRLIYHHDLRIKPVAQEVRKAISKIGVDIFDYFLQVQMADISAQSSYMQEHKFRTLKEIREIYISIMENKECVTISQLEVNGKDLLEIGIKQGKRIGEILGVLLEVVLEDPSKNNKEHLLEIAKRYR